MKYLKPVYTFAINEEMGMKDIVTGLSILASVLLGQTTEAQSLNNKELQKNLTHIITNTDSLKKTSSRLPKDTSEVLLQNQFTMTSLLDTMPFRNMVNMYQIKNKMNDFKVDGLVKKEPPKIVGDGVNLKFYSSNPQSGSVIDIEFIESSVKKFLKRDWTKEIKIEVVEDSYHTGASIKIKNVSFGFYHNKF